MTPEEFIIKYPDLQVQSEVSFGKAHYWLIKKKGAKTDWDYICQMSSEFTGLQPAYDKYPDLAADILSIQPYYDAWERNVKGKRAFQMPGPSAAIKKLFIKPEMVLSDDANYVSGYALNELKDRAKRESEVLNMLIEVTQSFTVTSYDLSDEALCVEYTKPNGEGGFRIDCSKTNQVFKDTARLYLEKNVAVPPYIPVSLFNLFKA